MTLVLGPKGVTVGGEICTGSGGSGGSGSRGRKSSPPYHGSYLGRGNIPDGPLADSYMSDLQIVELNQLLQ